MEETMDNSVPKQDEDCTMENNSQLPTYSQWMLDWITEAPADHSMILAVAMWHIWENRNCSRNVQRAATGVRPRYQFRNGLCRRKACY